MNADSRRRLVTDLTHLMRLPTGDPLSLRAFFDEAQVVVRRARTAGVDVPPAVLEWIASAELRSKDAGRSAQSTAALVEAMKSLEAQP